MATATEIVEQALGWLGVLSAGETLGADDAELCRGLLNTMLDAWNLPSLTLYATTDATATLGAGSTSLTIGPAMQLAVTRPVGIAAGSWVRCQGIDYPLEEIGEPEYNRIALKSLGGFVPSRFFYDPGASTGTVYYWPSPSTSVVVHHPVLTQFAEFADLTTDYVLPQGYKKAIVTNLAVEVAPHYDQPVSPMLANAAANSLRLVKRSNHKVPQMDVGSAIPGVLEGFYSGYST